MYVSWWCCEIKSRREPELITRYVPNILSILRIILSILLIKFLSIPIPFFIIYILIGFSDVLDGYIARKTGHESDLGATLDSTADFIFYCILVFIFYKRYPWILENNYQIVMTIVVIRLSNIILTKLKYKKVVFIHTLGNKISGMIIYLMPMALSFIGNGVLIKFLLLIIVLAATEELIITIKYEEPNLNRQSIFRE